MRRAYQRMQNGDDTGSLPMALLLSLVGFSLSALMIPMILTQTNATRAQTQRVHALNAAQSGLDVALAHIRAADDGSGTGVLADLPCGTISGDVDAVGMAQYQVSIAYFPSDPQGRDATWIATNTIGCLAGGGTSATPAFAALSSHGTDNSATAAGPVASRDLTATYTFKTSNENIAGGLIPVYTALGGTDLCMDAGVSSPTAGDNLLMQPCSPGSLQQTFAYNKDLTFVLVSSKTAAAPLGMCLDAGTPQGTGSVVVFQPCVAVVQPQQQWSFDDQANIEGTHDGISLDGLCFNVQSPDTPGSFVVLGTPGVTCKIGDNNRSTFAPDASVGAGAAGAASGELVSFAQFGRCLDVTQFNLNTTFLIAWPCKQAPDPTKVGWNQRWSIEANSPTDPSQGSRITTNPGSTLYCLHSPELVDQYVTIAPCPATVSPTDGMTWMISGDTGVYETGYRIIDNSGFCLAPIDPTSANPDLYGKGTVVSKIVVTTCGPSTLQKWNAPAGIQAALPLKDLTEK